MRLFGNNGVAAKGFGPLTFPMWMEHSTTELSGLSCRLYQVDGSIFFSEGLDYKIWNLD